MDDRQLPDLSTGPGTAGPGLRWFFFGLSGRVSRMPYLLGTLFLTVLSIGIMWRLVTFPDDGGEFVFWSFVLVLTMPVFLWATVAMAVKRLHDFNIPGPVAICLFVPAVSLLAVLVMCLWPGNPGNNDYGDETNRPKGG